MPQSLKILARVLVAATAIGTATSTASATDAAILALTENMECFVYRLSVTRQRIPLRSTNTIPNAPSAWALVNEGPSSATIFASSGERIPLPVFSGSIELFIGDVRYSYSVGLSKSGSAMVRVCR